LSEVAYKINHGHGLISRLLGDKAWAQPTRHHGQFEKGSAGLNENMEAAKHNFLLRGYFKRRKRRG
jgi:phospholipid/cholesterol/gamma-HCH transport system substrate-binding protein